MIQFIFGFLIAILSFHINHKIKRIVDIRILINTIFDVYGYPEAFIEYDKKEVSNQLMQEIFNVEKMYDKNPYIKSQVQKVKNLRKLYTSDGYPTKQDLKLIKFKPLGRTFMFLALFNLDIESLIYPKKPAKNLF